MTTTEPTPAHDWDPPPGEREYFRDHGRGDRGYLVRREGKDCIRLDRPEQELVVPFTGSWKRDEFGSLYLSDQIAQVAFHADRGVCALVGLHAESRKQWRELSDKERIHFIRRGPPDGAHPLRRLVYESIFEAAKPYTR